MMTKTLSSWSPLTTPLLHAAVGQQLADAFADKSSLTSNPRLTWSFGTSYKQYAEFIAKVFSNYFQKGIYSVNVV